MSQQKVVNKLERKIKSDTNKRNGKFLESQAKQIKNFNFVSTSTLDYSDPRTQVFLMLLLSASVIRTQANRSPQSASQSAAQDSTTLSDSTAHNNTTVIATDTLIPSVPTQNINSPAPPTFFSHQFAHAQMSIKKSFISPFEEENRMCVVPSRNRVTEPFSLIKHDLINGDFNAVLRKVPIIDDINSLYTKFTLINGGSENKIYLAIDKAGNEIALRVSASTMSFVPRNLAAYGKLAKTREFSSYIPEIFAVYYAKNTNFNGLYARSGDFVFCTEMEFIPKNYESLYYINRINQLMGPRTIFEEVLGDYVVEKVAECNINDADGDVLRHHLYREDENPVCYRIGDEIYLFPPGISPHKVDYDNFYCSSGTGGSFRRPYSFLFEHALEEMRSFLNDINQKGRLFESIKLHFSEFSISEEELKNYPNAKHFNLTELADIELQQSTQPEASSNQLRI